jgi:hypothetical protein
LVPVRAGRHAARLEVQARYSNYQSRDVLVYLVSVIAIALPSA